MNIIFLVLIEFYQRYISAILPASCRYYPSCSEYSLWQFKHNSFFRAFFATIFRILRCNPFFDGGIEYPRIRLRISPLALFGKNYKERIRFWFIPCKNSYYYVIKSLN